MFQLVKTKKNLYELIAEEFNNLVIRFNSGLIGTEELLQFFEKYKFLFDKASKDERIRIKCDTVYMGTADNRVFVSAARNVFESDIYDSIISIIKEVFAEKNTSAVVNISVELDESRFSNKENHLLLNGILTNKNRKYLLNTAI